jgi:hypothetical protein
VITALGRDVPPVWARSLAFACTGGMVYGVGQTIRDGETWQLAVCPGYRHPGLGDCPAHNAPDRQDSPRQGLTRGFSRSI